MTEGEDPSQLPAEARARKLIDEQLVQAGWVVQDKRDLNLFAGKGVAVREVVMKPGHGRVDYLLYVDRAVIGVIEAKPVGTPLSGVEWQSAMYAEGLPPDVRLAARTQQGRLPFVFEASGVETHFTNGFDPDPRARLIFNVPRPETLSRLLRDAEEDPARPTWRAKVRELPELDTELLRPAQIEAINGTERSLAAQQFDRSLIQMATGAGKTYTAVTQSYRLLKHGGFKRVLFLVDRNNLATQTLGEFQNYRTPDDGRRFSELYNVAKLTGVGPLGSTAVAISTIQRVFQFIKAGEVSDEDDPNLDDYVPDTPVTVSYSQALPPETFDLVIVDEAHRSIYGVWRGVLEYFDAHVVGLTATPGKQTFAFFRQNLVSDYTYPESVADGVNVDFDVYRIRTKISEQGSRIDAGTIVPKVDRRTRAQRLEALDEDLDYGVGQLNRDVTATDQIRTVLETFRDRLFTEIFPARSTVPKTLIFAKDDNHAEEIVKRVREVFGKGNEFAAKITYTARNAKEQLQALRTSPTLRIAVTVDMIATGTDVKPLECVFFMRDVRSAQYFEQMKGRGARTIGPADFQAVTPDAKTKTRFVIVDAVGVTEHDFVEPPLNRQKSVALKTLLDKVANLTITEDEAATLASRLAKLELDLTDAERAELDGVAGRSVRGIVKVLVDAVEPSTTTAAAIEAALVPVASNPELRQRMLELHAAHDRVIDEVSSDELLEAGGKVDVERAESIVQSWQSYLDEHRDEITALQVGYEAGERRIDFGYIEGLAARIARPPHNWTPETIWNAYAALDAPKVRNSATHTVADLVSLIRFTTGVDDELVPYADRVRERYASWLAQQEQAGVTFSEAERWWLDHIVSVIASSAGIRVEDLDDAPFTERGGTDGAIRDLGERTAALIDELNVELTA